LSRGAFDLRHVAIPQLLAPGAHRGSGVPRKLVYKASTLSTASRQCSLPESATGVPSSASLRSGTECSVGPHTSNAEGWYVWSASNRYDIQTLARRAKRAPDETR
jgi:hypothetical protein